jgi:hypothetical protein
VNERAGQKQPAARRAPPTNDCLALVAVARETSEHFRAALTDNRALLGQRRLRSDESRRSTRAKEKWIAPLGENRQDLLRRRPGRDPAKVTLRQAAWAVFDHLPGR